MEQRQVLEPVQVAEETPLKYLHNKLASFLYFYTHKYPNCIRYTTYRQAVTSKNQFDREKAERKTQTL